MAKRISRSAETEPDPDAPDVTPARGGDLEAFERLYERHAARMNSLAEWMLGTTDTEDVIQDVFVRAWRKLSTFRSDAPFGAWLRRIEVNVLLRYRERQRTYEERYVPDDESLHSAAAHGGDLHLYTEIESAIWRLPMRVREVLILHDMEGYKHGCIGIIGVWRPGSLFGRFD